MTLLRQARLQGPAQMFVVFNQQQSHGMCSSLVRR
jgi:hypothetical protein